ncbi:MAG TPA: hypothetical protein VK249_32355 [Anaerolineales bacterium]|nr:hypothetical protein [Anaerolineales bacterium]
MENCYLSDKLQFNHLLIVEALGFIDFRDNAFTVTQLPFLEMVK